MITINHAVGALSAALLAALPAAAAAQTAPAMGQSSNGMPINQTANNTRTYGYMDGDLKVQPNRFKAEPTVLFTNPTFAAALTKAMVQSGTGLPGTTLRMACAGFDTVGQCLAVLHASKAIGTSGAFDALRTALLSAGKHDLADAVRTVAPAADAKKIAWAATSKAQANCALVQRSGY